MNMFQAGFTELTGLVLSKQFTLRSDDIIFAPLNFVLCKSFTCQQSQKDLLKVKVKHVTQIILHTH